MGNEETDPRPPAWAGACVGCTLGAPSSGLSLVGLLASRARLRFTRLAPCYPVNRGRPRRFGGRGLSPTNWQPGNRPRLPRGTSRRPRQRAAAPAPGLARSRRDDGVLLV